MALEKKQKYQVTVLEDGQLQVRCTTQILEDGELISESYHRHVVDVGQDCTDECDMVKEIAQAYHTPARIKARKEFLAKQEAKQKEKVK
jgi:hypothetical protein